MPENTNQQNFQARTNEAQELLRKLGGKLSLAFNQDGGLITKSLVDELINQRQTALTQQLQFFVLNALVDSVLQSIAPEQLDTIMGRATDSMRQTVQQLKEALALKEQSKSKIQIAQAMPKL